MKKTILILVLLFAAFTPAVAEARLAGDWIGWGNWSFKGEGPGADCNPMTMTWSETADSISIEHGLFDCGIVAMHLGKTAWKLKQGELFDEANAKVGTYDGTSFSAYMPSPNENTTIEIKLKREANHYDYQEVWFNKYEKVYVIKGRLFTSGE